MPPSRVTVSPFIYVKVGTAELNDHAADFLLDVAVVACRRHVDVGLERLGISILEVLEAQRSKQAGTRC